MRERDIYPQDCPRTVRSRRNRFGNTELACSPKYHGAKTAYWAVGRQSGNWDLRPGCSVSTNWRLLGTVHEFESTRSQMDSITMATAIRSKKWKATASPGGENREAGAGARSGSRRLISTVCCG